jgi:penicillin amidase
MDKIKINIIGGITACIAIIIALCIFLYTLTTKSATKEEGTIKVEQLKNITSIYRNEFGVPHIIAENDFDLFFAFGYATAEDRLWQMDIQRRLGEGKLSEIFGDETIELDIFIKTLGIEKIAEKIEANLNPQSKEALQAYADGINYYITQNKKKLHIEFDILNYEPTPWQIKHSLIIYRLFAWQMNLNWWTDLITIEISKKIGIARTNELLSSSISSATNISTTRTFDNLIRVITKSKNYYSLYSPSFSNSFVIGSKKSMSNKPIIAINPDFSMTIPSVWYQASLHSDNIDVTGLTMPGIPCIMIGNNEKLAWGFSNGTIDDCDYYLELIDTLGMNRYFFDNNWNNLSNRKEKVIIKNAEPLEFLVYETNKGPILSNEVELKAIFDYRKDETSNTIIPLKGQHISIKWSGLEITDDILGFLLMNKSKSIIEIQEAIKLIKSPALQFIFCDESNIGSRLTGLAPMRSLQNSNNILPGTSSQHIWKNFINQELLPSIINPANNYIVTTTSRLSTKLDFNSYNNTSFERMTQLLNSKELLSIEDVKNIQNDVLSINAQTLLPIILNILEHRNNNEYYYDQSIIYLKNWNYLVEKSSIPASIYNVLIFKIIKNTLNDELGDALFEKLCFIPNLPINIITKLITENKNSWFNDLNNNNQIETKEDIIYRSFIETLDFLKSKLGPETKNWRWTGLHQLTLTHPLSNNKHLNKIFNVGPFEQNGSSTSINSSHYDYSNPFDQVFGTASRFFCDMIDPNNSFSIISSGACGDPFSRNYKNQITLLINGDYITLNNQKEIIKSSGFKHLKLLPK